MSDPKSTPDAAPDLSAEQIAGIIRQHCYPFSDVGIGGITYAADAILAALRAERDEAQPVAAAVHLHHAMELLAKAAEFIDEMPAAHDADPNSEEWIWRHQYAVFLDPASAHVSFGTHGKPADHAHPPATSPGADEPSHLGPTCDKRDRQHIWMATGWGRICVECKLTEKTATSSGAAGDAELTTAETAPADLDDDQATAWVEGWNACVRARPASATAEGTRERAEASAEMLAVLKDIYRVTGLSSRASMEEQTNIMRRMRKVIAKAEGRASEDPPPYVEPEP